MIDRVGVHRFDDTEIVSHLRQMGQQLAHPNAVLPFAVELVLGRRHQLRLALSSSRSRAAPADTLGQRLFEQFPRSGL